MTAQMSTKKVQAAVELGSAGAIWGFGFVVTVWILPSVGPIWISGIRLFFAAFIVGLGALMFPKLRARFARADFFIAAIPASALASMLVLQTAGLRFTSATNSGFITTLYVVLVPLVQLILTGKRISVRTLILIVVAFFGTALIANVDSEGWNIGDLLTLACAFAAAFHILVIDKLASRARSPLSLNTFQSFWGAVFCIPIALVLEPVPTFPLPTIAWVGLAYLTVISTMIAFLIQIRAQRVLSPITASLLFLLESPFTAIFAYLFLKDQLSATQWFGGTLILASAALCILRPEPKI